MSDAVRARVDGSGQDNEAASERLRPRRPRSGRLGAASDDPTEL